MSEGASKPTAADGGHYIGPYRIERRLGRGGMGEVYLAFDERLERRVAIKRIRADKLARGEHRARLRREARAVARLSHPAVAHVHDVVFDDDGDAIVMEYVEGRTLARLLQKGAVDGGLAINVAIQVAQGLAAAHQLGMVHRDLKAENVMVTPAGRAKILDFGLVKHSAPEATRSDLTLQGMLLGTVGSMSPEQASGRRVDARSDLFSFGILLYELFTGLSPFRRDRWFESLRSIKRDRQTPAHVARPEVPLELSHLIEWLLRKEPELRPQSAWQVVDLLARVAATTGVGRLRPPPACRARQRASGDGSGTPSSGWPAARLTPTAVALRRAAGWRSWVRRWLPF